MPELDQRIRAALSSRADHFEPDPAFEVRLGRARRRRTRRRVTALALVAAAVLVVVAMTIPAALGRHAHKIDTTGHGHRWKIAVRNEHVGQLNGSGAVAGGSLFVTAEDGARTSRVLRLDATSLRVRASLQVPGSEVNLFSGFGSVWAVREQDPRSELRRIDPHRVRVVATIRLPISVDSVVTGGGRIWVGNGDGAVVTVDPRTGGVRPVANSHIVGSPTRPNLKLFTVDGGVWAAGTFDGTTRAQLVRLDRPAVAPVPLPGDPFLFAGGDGSVFAYGDPPTASAPATVSTFNIATGTTTRTSQVPASLDPTSCPRVTGAVLWAGVVSLDLRTAAAATLPLPATQAWTGFSPGLPAGVPPPVRGCTVPGADEIYVVAPAAVARLTGG